MCNIIKGFVLYLLVGAALLKFSALIHSAEAEHLVGLRFFFFIIILHQHTYLVQNNFMASAI
jgi:hypothetical protein